MTNEDFMKLWHREIHHLTRMQERKGDEYSRGEDRLSNFKRGASFRNTTPEDYLAGLVAKQQISLQDMVQDTKTGMFGKPELWREKISDIIIYGILLLAIVEEREDCWQDEIEIESEKPQEAI